MLRSALTCRVEDGYARPTLPLTMRAVPSRKGNGCRRSVAHPEGPTATGLAVPRGIDLRYRTVVSSGATHGGKPQADATRSCQTTARSVAMDKGKPATTAS